MYTTRIWVPSPPHQVPTYTLTTGMSSLTRPVYDTVDTSSHGLEASRELNNDVFCSRDLDEFREAPHQLMGVYIVALYLSQEQRVDHG